MQRPDRPTPELVREYVRRFDEGRNGIVDKALLRLFQTFPHNQQTEHVMFKVLGLNALYNTNINAVTPVVKHIVSLDIDPQLAVGAPELVNAIALTPLNDGQTHRNYSFATKYCSWHVPAAYPIFDNVVEKLVYEYQQLDQFTGFFWRNELAGDYRKFKAIVAALRDAYGLTDFSFKELDKFLWLYGKEYFGKAAWLV